jgi:myo-inositol-1(or 4)-monophosphatase
MTDRPPTSHAEDLELLRSGAVTAGIIASGFFRRDLKTWTKANASPVTEADLVVDRHLHAALTVARPDYGWLSEETADNPDRLACRRVFVVDPIDGTRGFIRGEDNWTISLAVVEDGIAVAGVVYAPVRNEMFEAAKGGGARFNGAPIVRQRADGPPVISTAGAVHGELQAAGLDYVRGPYFPSLAYRLAQVAMGALDALGVRRGASDWDIAGAAAILAECGIGFADVCVEPLRFNKSDVRHGALAASADESLKSVLRAALIRVYGCPAEDSSALGLENRTT